MNSVSKPPQESSSANGASGPESPDERLDRALAEYLQADERGEPLDSRAWLAAHPEFASELTSFLENRRAMQRLAAQLPPHELSTAGAGQRVAAASDFDSPPREFGDFELLDELARGGMGVVYRARQKSLQRIVALKVVRISRDAAHPDTARFRQEAEAAARLDHPHIVPIYEVGELDGRAYFTMKLVEGGDLHRRLEALRHDPTAAATLVEKIARAVHFAHQHGVLHRDLKPANILLDSHDEPLVADFGLARVLDSDARITLSGAALGTPGYMAPEQIRGERQATTAADVYSLGAILYACVTGHAPFQGATPWTAMRQALEGDPPSPRSLNRRVPRDLETICRKALERSPALRYDSAAAFAEDLARWLRHEPIAAQPPNLVRRAGKWLRRHPIWSVALAFVACLAAFGAAQLELLRRANDRAATALYRTQMALAEREWSSGAIPFARAALDECEPSRRGWEWSFARRLCDVTPANRLGTFSQILTSGGFSADGRRRCAIDATGAAWVWDDRGSLVATAKVEPRESRPLIALSPPGDRLAIATGGFVVQHQVQSALSATSPLATSPAPDSPAQDSPARVSSISNAVAPRQWEAQVPGHVLQLAYAPRAERLVVLSSSENSKPRSLTLTWLDFDGQTVATQRLAPSETARDEFFCFDASQHRLLSSRPLAPAEDADHPPTRSRHAVQAFDDVTGEPQGDIPQTDRAGPPLAISSDGRLVAYRGNLNSGQLEIIDTERGVRRTVPLEGTDTFGYEFSPDARMLAYVSLEMNFEGLTVAEDLFMLSDGATLSPRSRRPDWIAQVHVLDVATGSELNLLRGFPAQTIRLVFSPDSRLLLAIGGAAENESRGIAHSIGAALLWEVPARLSARRLQASDQAVRDISFVNGGRQLVTAGDDGVVRLWDAATGSLVRELHGHDDKITSLARGANEDELISASGTGILAWDLRSGRMLRQLADVEHPYRGFHSVATAPGQALAALADYQRVVVTSIDGGSPRFQLPEKAQFVSFSPDGRWLAVPQQFELHGKLLVIDTASGQVRREFQTEPVGAGLRLGWGYVRAAFSPDSRMVAVVGNIGGIHLYDLRTGRRIRVFHGHGVTVWDVAFTSDGSRLATSGYNDRTVKLWSVARGEEVHTLRGHLAPVTRLAFSPDDSRLASADEQGTVLIWDRGSAE